MRSGRVCDGLVDERVRHVTIVMHVEVVPLLGGANLRDNGASRNEGRRCP